MDNRIVNFPTPWKRLTWRKLDERSIEASIDTASDLLEAAQGAHRERYGVENAFIRRALLELSLVNRGDCTLSRGDDARGRGSSSAPPPEHRPNPYSHFYTCPHCCQSGEPAEVCERRFPEDRLQPGERPGYWCAHCGEFTSADYLYLNGDDYE